MAWVLAPSSSQRRVLVPSDFPHAGGRTRVWCYHARWMLYWFWNFFIVLVTPVIINRLVWRAYLIFMVTNFQFVPVIYYFFPDTSNFTREVEDQFFASGENPIAVARCMTKEMKEGGYRHMGAQPPDTEKDQEQQVE
jgi:hypothetical protein